MGYLHRRRSPAPHTPASPWFDPAAGAVGSTAGGDSLRLRKKRARREKPYVAFTPVAPWFDPAQGPVQTLPPHSTAPYAQPGPRPRLVAWLDDDGVSDEFLPPGGSITPGPLRTRARVAAYAVQTPWTDLTPAQAPPPQCEQPEGPKRSRLRQKPDVYQWATPSAAPAPEALPPYNTARVDQPGGRAWLAAWIEADGITDEQLPEGRSLSSTPKPTTPRLAAYSLPSPWTELGSAPAPEALPPGASIQSLFRAVPQPIRPPLSPFFDPAPPPAEASPPAGLVSYATRRARSIALAYLANVSSSQPPPPPAETIPEGFADLATPRRDRLRTQLQITPWYDAVDKVSYDGPDVLSAIQAWWADQTALHATIGSKLYHMEAPEGVDPPYATYFTVAETERDGRSTGYTYLDTVVQFSFHAETDRRASSIRKAFRATILNAPLSVDGLPVWYVLPGDQTLSIGEGFGRHGRDCWIATVDVTIPWRTDAV